MGGLAARARRRRRAVLVMLCLTVLAPIVLYTDKLATFSNSARNSGFVDDVSILSLGNEAEKLKSLSQEHSVDVKKPVGIVYAKNSSSSDQDSASASHDGHRANFAEHRSRVLRATNEGSELERTDVIRQVTSRHNDNDSLDSTHSEKQENNQEKSTKEASAEGGPKQNQLKDANSHNSSTPMLDARVRHMKDQLIRAKVYLGFGSIRSNAQYIKELRARIRDIQRALGDAAKDSELPKNAYAKLKAMDQTLAKGKQIQDDCSAATTKLRSILHSTEDQLHAHQKQTEYLTQLAAKTLPRGLHCLPLRLTSEYYSLDSSQKQFPNQEKLGNPELYHYALFSDNVLAAAVVVNSTVINAKSPENHVFHIVTDRLNYAAMRMWFLANPPGKATIQVQNVEEFTWLNSSYSPVLKQLESQSMIDYYFRTHRNSSDANLKFRNPKYLSILNHLRFYLPEILPKINKVVFLDDDIVAQKDLTGLWAIDLKGKVNGAVETCGASFHRFDRYLNFSNPLIAKNFDPRACGWAYGMNVFDLVEWRKQNITEIYHAWQELNHDRLLWKLGTLPPGLITFWNRTFPLDRSWHVLGLGYNPDVNQKNIEKAAVIHYNGNMKPWLEIAMSKYRNYWSKYVGYHQVYLRDCNINP